MRFSRKDDTELPGFEENDYTKNCNVKNQSLLDLKNEFEYVRKYTISLFNNMTPEMLNFIGKANNVKYSTLALGFIIIGHNLHHCKVIETRYLKV